MHAVLFVCADAPHPDPPPLRLRSAGEGTRTSACRKQKGTDPLIDLSPFFLWPTGQLVSWPVAHFQISPELLTNAIVVPSGDHDGTLIIPWPP